MLNLILKPLLLMALVVSISACSKRGSAPSVPPKSEGAKGGTTGTGTPPSDDRSGGSSRGGGAPSQPNRNDRYAGPVGDRTTGRPGQTSPYNEGDRYAGPLEQGSSETIAGDVSGVIDTDSGPANNAYGDYLQNPPGFPYPLSLTPIKTGAMTFREYEYVDANNDFLMSYLVTLANEQMDRDKAFAEDSLRLAKMIDFITVNTLNRATSDLNILFSIKDGDRTYRIPFVGRMTANRRAVLENIDSKTTYMEIDRKKADRYKERKFRLTMICVDKTSGCQSIIMRLDQLFLKEGVNRLQAKETDWQLCRSVFALARQGEVHLQIDEHDYVNYPSYPDNQRMFVELLANSAHYVRHITKSKTRIDRKSVARPRLYKNTIDSWAVAYGAAGFDVHLQTAAGLNHQGMLGGNILTLHGPMLYATSRISNDNEITPIATNVEPGMLQYANLIKNAMFVENDGAGQFAMVINFKGVGDAEDATQVSFTTLFAETVNPFEQRNGKMRALEVPEMLVAPQKQL